MLVSCPASIASYGRVFLYVVHVSCVTTTLKRGSPKTSEEHISHQNKSNHVAWLHGPGGVWHYVLRACFFMHSMGSVRLWGSFDSMSWCVCFFMETSLLWEKSVALREALQHKCGFMPRTIAVVDLPSSAQGHNESWCYYLLLHISSIPQTCRRK